MEMRGGDVEEIGMKKQIGRNKGKEGRSNRGNEEKKEKMKYSK